MCEEGDVFVRCTCLPGPHQTKSILVLARCASPSCCRRAHQEAYRSRGSPGLPIEPRPRIVGSCHPSSAPSKRRYRHDLAVGILYSCTLVSVLDPHIRAPSPMRTDVPHVNPDPTFSAKRAQSGRCQADRPARWVM
jgi:hypothetical protein